MESESPLDPWAQFAVEQARIIANYLEKGGRDEKFLRLHAGTLLQSINEAFPGRLPEELKNYYVS